MEETLSQLIQENPLTGALIFIVARAIAIIIAPIPGAVVDAPGIAAFGWKLAFIYAEIGIMVGATTAFYIARFFREPLIRRFTSLRRVQEWEEQLPPRDRFWAWVALRLPTNPFFDTISYAAGLTNCKPGLFIASTFVGNVPSMFVFYLVGGKAFEYGIYYGISAIFGILALMWIVYRHTLRKRRKNSP